MRYFALSLGLLLFAAAVFWVATPSLLIEEELAKLTPGDRQALESLVGEAGLESTKLRPIELRELKYASKSVAVQDGRVVALRLSNLPLRKLDALAGLTGLRELWLSGNGLTSARGVSALPALSKLNLSHNALTQVDELHDLPALTELDLTHNQLTDVSPLTALPALQTLDVSDNPLKVLPTPSPERWSVKSDFPEKTASPRRDRPGNWVQQPPKTNGQAGSGKREGMVTADSYQYRGTLDTLRGAVTILNIVGTANSGGADTTLELSVNKGHVRAYLEYVVPSEKFLQSIDGYIYAEAEPSKPGQIKGVLHKFNSGNKRNAEYWLVLESVEGDDAQGITYKLSR
jgi:Leucine-rich repeat (LRR) protein